MEPIRDERRKLVGGEIIFLMGRNGMKALALKGKRVVGLKSIKYKRKWVVHSGETSFYSKTKDRTK